MTASISGTPGERLKVARVALGKTGQEIGETLGVTKAGVSAWETNKAALSRIICMAIQHAFGISSQWLLTGEGPMWDTSRMHVPMDFESIPLLGGVVTCGDGGEIQDPGPGAIRLPFRSEFIRDILMQSGAGTVADLYCAECAGESMRPTVHPGDLVLVNTNLKLRLEPSRDGLYLVRPEIDSMDTRIKRVRLDQGEGRLVFLSDNPGWRPVSVDLRDRQVHTLILGRVCWVARPVLREELPGHNW